MFLIDKEFLNNEKQVKKNNKIIYINKFLVQKNNLKIKSIQKIKELVNLEEYQKMGEVGRHY